MYLLSYCEDDEYESGFEYECECESGEIDEEFDKLVEIFPNYIEDVIFGGDKVLKCGPYRVGLGYVYMVSDE